MSTKKCLRDMCCLCEEFRVTRNEFDDTFVCTCSLNGKGIVIPDVTLITPETWLNGFDWRIEDENIYDEEKEIEDIHSIQINEKVEYIGNDFKYAALHHWLTVFLIVEEEE